MKNGLCVLAVLSVGLLCSCGDSTKIDALISSATTTVSTTTVTSVETIDESSMADTVATTTTQFSDSRGDDVEITTTQTEAAETETTTTEEVTTTTVEEVDAIYDVDLTQLSATMVYAEVNQMVTVPTDYMGKTVKMNGQLRVMHNDELGTDYFFVVIADATACCSQGIEFIWDNGNKIYPDDFPTEYTEVVVTGTFSSYDELGTTYYYIDADALSM